MHRRRPGRLEGQEVAAARRSSSGVTSRAPRRPSTCAGLGPGEKGVLQGEDVSVDRRDGEPDLLHPVEHGALPVEPGRVEGGARGSASRPSP